MSMNSARWVSAKTSSERFCGRTRPGSLHLDPDPPERLKRSDVRPSEIAAHRRDAPRFFHERVVDGDGRHRLVVLECDTRDLRRDAFELAAKDTHPPDEHPGVPRIVSEAHKLLGAFAGGFLGEATQSQNA